MSVLLSTTKGLVVIQDGAHTMHTFKAEGRHRDRVGNVRRDAEDAGRGAIVTLTTATAGLVVVAAGMAFGVAMAITAGVWVTLIAGTVGAVLLWMEGYIHKQAKRMERCADEVGHERDDVVPGEEHPVVVQGGEPIPLLARRSDVSSDEGLYLSRTSTDESEHGPARVAFGAVPVERSAVRGRWGGSTRQRLAMVRRATGPHPFPKFEPANTNFLTQSDVGSTRRVR
jgi:hypothetical protein